MRAWRALTLGAVGLVAGCDRAEPLPPVHTLTPDPNPIRNDDPLNTPQPHRDRPRTLCAHGDTVYVTMPGTEDSPGNTLAVVDAAVGALVDRVTLPGAPWACAVDPSGRFVVVTLRYSDRAVVVDAETHRELRRIAVPYYTESVLFAPDGRRVYFTNRWKDSVLSWEVDTDGGFDVRSTTYDGVDPWDPMGTPVGDNPGPMALSADGRRLFVGTVTGVTVAVLDAETLDAIDVDADPQTTTIGAPPGISRIDFHSPVGGLAVSGRHLFIADTGPGTGSLPAEGRDLNDDGTPGDGTANVVFQDLQNEIAVVDTETFKPVHRYTSDSICCHDFRDVDPDHPERGPALAAPDTWSPDVLKYLPPKETWIVAGSLPEAMTVVPARMSGAAGDRLFVAFAGSNEVQSFDIAADGSLSPRQTAGKLFQTGYNPKGIVVAGGHVLTANRLGESVTILPAGELGGSGGSGGSGASKDVTVGDVEGGPFPATDAELGEGINEMTSFFTLDGDQTCVHCHRENGSIARPIIMPLQADRRWGARNIMAQRGLYDTRPWFFESAMGERNFFPVLNEFARRENFCCEEMDTAVWSKYPTHETCDAAPETPGCDSVLNCMAHPPPECAQRPYGGGEFLRRGDFIRAGARRLFGRDVAFGDVLSDEDFDGLRRPIALDFDGLTRAVGLFMLRTPRLLPNPNRALDLPTAGRGAALFSTPSVGCSNCHPLPRTTTAGAPNPFSPSGMPIRFPPVISPTRAPDGGDASRVTPGFMQTFPDTVQGPAGLRLGATPLRGLWDRPSTRFFHDGRGRSLREALATPGHPALAPGDTGRNERDGVFDTHGGTSQLDKYQLEDLMNFLMTL